MSRRIFCLVLVAGLTTGLADVAQAQGSYLGPIVPTAGHAEALLPPARSQGQFDPRYQQLEQRVHNLEVRRLPQVAEPSYFSAFTRGASVADELEEIRGEVIEQGAAIESIEGDVSKLGKRKVDAGTSNNTMKVSGRIHADYWGFPDSSTATNILETNNPNMSPQDRILFRRIRFGVAGDVGDNMQYKIEMEFAEGNDVEFRDVYLGFDHLPIAQTLLIGNQKRPYGLDHLNSSRYNIFLERPFVVEGYNEDTRRVGIASYGVSPELFFNWRYGVYNMRKIADEGAYINDDLQLEFASRLASTYWYDETSDGRGYAHFAVSGTMAYPDGTAPNNGTQDNEARFRTRPEARSSERWLDTGRIAGASRYQLLGFEKGLNIGPVQFIGEYQNVWLHRDSGFGASRDLHFHGGYVYVNYMLTGEHVPWERDSGTLGRLKPFEDFFLVRRIRGGVGGGWGAWGVGLRYSHGDFTDYDIMGGVADSYTLALNWWWNANARMQFNYINGYLKERGPLSGENFTGQLAGDYDIIGTRFLIDF
ncbi:MAG: porin [Pirellulaceae bacterium]